MAGPWRTQRLARGKGWVLPSALMPHRANPSAMSAWSGDPVPESLVRSSGPRELQGALVFQNKSCRNCHALEGSGGTRGPDLTIVGRRLTRDQLVTSVSKSRTISKGSIPSTRTRPVASDTAMTNGIVNPMDASTEPSRTLTERWRLCGPLKPHLIRCRAKPKQGMWRWSITTEPVKANL